MKFEAAQIQFLQSYIDLKILKQQRQQRLRKRHLGPVYMKVGDPR